MVRFGDDLHTFPIFLDFLSRRRIALAIRMVYHSPLIYLEVRNFNTGHKASFLYDTVHTLLYVASCILSCFLLLHMNLHCKADRYICHKKRVEHKILLFEATTNWCALQPLLFSGAHSKLKYVSRGRVKFVEMGAHQHTPGIKFHLCTRSLSPFGNEN